MNWIRGSISESRRVNPVTEVIANIQSEDEKTIRCYSNDIIEMNSNKMESLFSQRKRPCYIDEIERGVCIQLLGCLIYQIWREIIVRLILVIRSRCSSTAVHCRSWIQQINIIILFPFPP
uniref:Uncharacterized protein n=1 Tax=Cucumis sativus TaxID=3659 RepID=A0A0A0KRW1_CUCSA